MLKKNAIIEIENSIGYEFKNKQLLTQAFTRSSYHYEHPKDQDNEVLEFYGDAVLSLAISDILLEKYTDQDGSGMYSFRTEGDLSALRSALTNKRYLAKQMSKLCLQDYLRVSIGDQQQGVQNGKSVLEDLFESIVGAIYLDSGKKWSVVKNMVSKILDVDKFLAANDGEIRISYKNSVQEWCQRFGYDRPEYDTRQNWDGSYVSVCEVEELGVRERADGNTKKEAENNAAELVLERLEEDFEPDINRFIVNYENAINMLQEHCQSEGYDRPNYETVEDIVYDDNSHKFTVRCYLNRYWVDGEGSKIKEAKKQAAFNMMKYMGLVD